MSYEYTDASTGQRYYQEGRRVYRITERGNLVYDHDVTPDQPAVWQRLLAVLRRLLAWLRRLLGV